MWLSQVPIALGSGLLQAPPTMSWAMSWAIAGPSLGHDLGHGWAPGCFGAGGLCTVPYSVQAGPCLGCP